jgi:hypothetical protein
MLKEIKVPWEETLFDDAWQPWPLLLPSDSHLLLWLSARVAQWLLPGCMATGSLPTAESIWAVCIPPPTTSLT